VIEGLTRYAQYAEPEAYPIGSIPSHWRTFRAKALFREVDERSVTGQETLLSVSHISGVRRRSELNATMFLAKSNVGHKSCQPNDLVINTMWAWMGALGVSSYDGIVSPGYAVYRQRQRDIFARGYIEYLLRTPTYVAEYNLRSSGIHSSRLRLYPDQFLRIPLIVPPLEEQGAIVRFLDHTNRRIERFIRAKRKLIALLNEQKQAIIHRAVTRGLDPNVPMKDSGVPWLGEIPGHWEIVALGRLASARCDGPFGSGLKSMHYTDDGVRVVRLQNIGRGVFRGDATAFVSLAHYATLGDHGVLPGDLLVAGLGDEKIPAGRACVAPDRLGPAMVKADCFRFRLRPLPGLGDYLALHLSATAGAATACLSTGATRLRINLASTCARSVALPPYEERVSVCNYVANACAPLTAAEQRADHEIRLMREYRTRLFADVVTGQLDVRKAAANLPVDQLEAAHLSVALDEDDELALDESDSDSDEDAA
jgi:type I restriction enzyme, S subunit